MPLAMSLFLLVYYSQHGKPGETKGRLPAICRLSEAPIAGMAFAIAGSMPALRYISISYINSPYISILDKESG